MVPPMPDHPPLPEQPSQPADDEPPRTVSIGRDQINAQESQGYVHRAGTVNQNFGQQQNVYTAGGAYVVVNQILRPAPPLYRAAVLRMVEDYIEVFGGRDTE